MWGRISWPRTWMRNGMANGGKSFIRLNRIARMSGQGTKAVTETETGMTKTMIKPVSTQIGKKLVDQNLKSHVNTQDPETSTRRGSASMIFPS